MVQPIVWNQRTNRVVGGHQRLTVLEHEGHEETTVSVVDLDEKQEVALNLALNKTGGDWDYDKLGELLVDMDLVNLEVTGFSNDEIALLIPDMGDIEVPSADLGGGDESGDFDKQETEDEEEKVVNMKFPLTVEQREVVINAFKQIADGEKLTPSEALFLICEEYISR